MLDDLAEFFQAEQPEDRYEHLTLAQHSFCDMRTQLSHAFYKGSLPAESWTELQGRLNAASHFLNGYNAHYSEMLRCLSAARNGQNENVYIPINLQFEVHMSTQFQQITLFGRTGINPIVKNFKNGNKRASFPLASHNYVFEDSKTTETTNWIKVVAYGELASTIEKNLRKGQSVAIVGRPYKRPHVGSKGQVDDKLEFLATDIQIVTATATQKVEAPETVVQSIQIAERKAG
jgi:single-strand DNA-binding protein